MHHSASLEVTKSLIFFYMNAYELIWERTDVRVTKRSKYNIFTLSIFFKNETSFYRGLFGIRECIYKREKGSFVNLLRKCLITVTFPTT